MCIIFSNIYLIQNIFYWVGIMSERRFFMPIVKLGTYKDNIMEFNVKLDRLKYCSNVSTLDNFMLWPK